jgi:hypothetical protein
MLKKCDRIPLGLRWRCVVCDEMRTTQEISYWAATQRVAACYDYGKVPPDGASQVWQGTIGGSDLAEITE